MTLKPKSSEPKSIALNLGMSYSHSNEVKLGKAPAPNSSLFKFHLESVKFDFYNYLTAPPNPAGNTSFCKFVQLVNPLVMRTAVSCVPEPSGNSMLVKLEQWLNMLFMLVMPLRAPPSSSDMSIELKL